MIIEGLYEGNELYGYCVVIVWLLCGADGKNCLRFDREKSKLSKPNSACRLIFYKDTTKFSNFQIFRGDNFKKMHYCPLKIHALAISTILWATSWGWSMSN